jgi:hypothetical protein
MDKDIEHIDDDLTPEELEAAAAEPLPERAAMSTLNLTSLDAASGTVEAVGDGVPAENPDVHEPPMQATPATPSEPLEPAANPAEHLHGNGHAYGHDNHPVPAAAQSTPAAGQPAPAGADAVPAQPDSAPAGTPAAPDPTASGTEAVPAATETAPSGTEAVPAATETAPSGTTPTSTP